MPPRVKICCISSHEEARMAIAAGAAAIGLVGPMPSGPGVIDNELIASIAGATPPPVGTFLLTSETSSAAIIAHHQLVHTNTIQLVDAVDAGSYAAIRSALPNVKLVQVIHVRGEGSLDEALAAADEVDALLLDSGNPNLDVKVLGGTGKVHNWQLSRRIVEQSRVPVYLAGGLHAGNVREAIEAVQPFGIDLCSGVRTAKQLDQRKLDVFMNAVMRM